MKFWGLLTILFLAVGSQRALGNCIAGDCQNGSGKAQFKNGDVYAGQWQSGLMHGRGVYLFRTKARYEGQFYKGVMQGRGVMRYPDGAVYVGEWAGNKKAGVGRLVTPSGKTQDGRWADGQFAGAAEAAVSSTAPKPPRNNAATTAPIASKPSRSQTAANGSSSSDVHAGLRDCNEVYCEDGTGRYLYMDGAVYVGQFEDGQPSGRGKVTYVNGDGYTGEWFGNAPDGEGTFIFANGRSVLGRWEDGRLVQRHYRNDAGSALAQNQTQPASNRPTGQSSNRPATTPPNNRPQHAPPNNQATLQPNNRPQINRPADGRSNMYAVVVGIGAYSAMKTLNYTDDDAYQMYAFFKSPEGGALDDKHLELLIDESATANNIERALAEKLAIADADDIVVFYYSGHGVDGYFIPVDFDGVNHLLSHKRVEELFNASAARHKLVMADACHSGGLLAAKAYNSRSAERLYDAFAKSQGGTALLLSSRTEEVSLEASGLRSGVFSHFVMRGMRGEADADHDKIVTVGELYDYTYGRVRDYTGKRQSPVLSGRFDRGMPVASLR